MMGVDVNDQRVVLTGPRLLDLNTNQSVDVPLPPGNWQGFVGAALNNNNDFCGYILGWSGCSTFPIRYRQGIGWEFLGGCATTTSATAMNDRGDALLYYYMTTSGVHFVPDGYFALGSVIDPAQGEWYVQYGGANGINNARQIVAAARQGFSGPIGAVLLTPIAAVGDLNCDGVVNFDDINPFVLALSDPTGYQQRYPNCAVQNGDCNGDGRADFGDINPFVALLSGP